MESAIACKMLILKIVSALKTSMPTVEAVKEINKAVLKGKMFKNTAFSSR